MARLFFSLFFLILLGSALYWTLVDRVFEPTLTEMDDIPLTAVGQGPLFLAADRLRQAEIATYPHIMEELDIHFGDLLRLTDIHTLELSDEDIKQLRDTPVFILDLPMANPQPVALHLVEAGLPWVLIYGPVPEPEGIQALDALMQIGWLLLASLLLLIWIGRLYRKSRILEQAANAFGMGRFSERTGYSGKGFIGNLGHTFDQMAAKIEQLLETKNHIINAVSHELRTPLARLAFAVHFLEKEVSSESASSVISDIKEELRQLNDLVDELLKYSHLDYRLSSEPFEIVNLHKWVEEVAASHQRFDSNLNVDFADLDTGLRVSIIPKLMEKALSNLLVNAQTHRSKATYLHLKQDHAQLWFCISDDGPGIPEDQRERVLKPFVRLEHGQDQGGWGLGLTLTKKIVEWHQGQFLIGESKSGGSMFSLGLPIHTGP